MNYKPVAQSQSQSSQPALSSPKPNPGSRQHINSQMSKNNITSMSNNQGMKTPIVTDKKAKQQNFAMTPDIHSKAL